MTEKMKYKLEDHVNDWVKRQFDRLKLKNQKDYFTESAISDYLKEALRGRAKTENKTKGLRKQNATKVDHEVI